MSMPTKNERSKFWLIQYGSGARLTLQPQALPQRSTGITSLNQVELEGRPYFLVLGPHPGTGVAGQMGASPASVLGIAPAGPVQELEQGINTIAPVVLTPAGRLTFTS